MRKTIMVTAFVVTGAGAAGASAALPSQYQGSDTEFDLTTAAIAAAGLTPTNAYIGGGSGNAAAAMTNSPPTQYTGPMSRMMKSEAHICNFNGGTNGSTATGAESIVLGLDAVVVNSAASAGSQTTCNGSADNTGTGLAYSGTTGVFAGSTSGQNWKWVLALAYGGLDLSVGGAANCASTARAALVSNWSLLFQAGCTWNSTAATCTDGNHNGVLWHAFRRDDVSGTSDVFSSLLGLSPSTSNSAVNGFGASPFCNAMNWDTSTANANCAAGDHLQWTGPGGVPDTTSDTTGAHKKPPPNTWGANPDLVNGGGSFSSDVLPTQFQDNDPIRRTCLGSSVGNPNRQGEEVCNIDGKLGLVLPMPDSDWLLRLSTPLKQYPANLCTGAFFPGKAPTVFTCAPRNTKHSGECPNGDQLFGGTCFVPIDTTNNTSQCLNDKSQLPSALRTLPATTDGRIYNIHMRDGSVSSNGTLPYAQYNVAALGTNVFLDFVGGYSRIHTTETILPGVATPCQNEDMTDNIGCLAQADPCSIGYAGHGSVDWYNRAPTTGLTPPAPTSAGEAPLRVAQILPTTATVQLLGEAGEYQYSRKLYFASFLGFQNVVSDPDSLGTATSELALANWESTDANINPLLVTDGFFDLGPQSPGGAGTTGNGAQFCEDFNEDNICNGGKGAAGALGATNVNACAGINSAITHISNSQFTICGNGIVEAYEECDDGEGQTAKGSGKCSSTCRCTSQSIGTSTTALGDNGCQ